MDMNMTEGKLFIKIIVFAVPVMLSSMLQLLFNTVDMIVIGRFAGDRSLAAVGSCSSLINCAISMFIGVSIGANVLVSNAVGKKDYDEAQKACHTAIVFSLLAGLILSILGVIFARDLLILMNTTPEVLDLATLYARIFFSGSIFNMLFNFASAILKSVGETKKPLYYLTLAGVCNALLNLLFVIVFKMDVAGVALATIISQAISAVLVFVSLLRRDGYVGVRIRKLRIYPSVLGKMAIVGLPAGIQGSLISLSNVFIQRAVNSFASTVIVSGNTASQNIEGFIWNGMNAFYQACIAFTGQNYGAGKLKNCKRVLYYCLIDAAVVGLLLGGFAFIFDEQLLGLYTSGEAVEYGRIRIMVICLTYFTCGIMDVFVGGMRGLKFSTVPMIVSILGMVVFRIVWIMTVFEYNHELWVLYVSYPISWVVTSMVHLVSYVIIYHIIKKKNMNEVAVGQSI